MEDCTSISEDIHREMEEFKLISEDSPRKVEGGNLRAIFVMFGLKCIENEVLHSGGCLTWAKE